MGRQLSFARLIALATVWHGETRAQTALKQVDHINRKRDVNDPANLNFLDEVDDAGRSAHSQNTRAALLQGPSWLLRYTQAEDAAIHHKRLTVHYKRAALRDPVLGLGWRIADADEEATAAYVHEMDDCYFFDADADTEDATSIAAQYEHQRTHGKKGKKRKAPAPPAAPFVMPGSNMIPPAPPAARFVMPGAHVIPPAPPAARFVMPGAHVIPTGPAPVPEWGPAPPPRRTARSTKQRDYADPSKTGFGLCVPPAPALPRRLSLREFPCPAGCGRTFTHAPAAANHGKTCRRPRAPKRQATPQVSAPAAFANGDPPPPPPAADDAQADEVVMTGVTPASNSTPAPMDDDDDGVPEIPGTTI